MLRCTQNQNKYWFSGSIIWKLKAPLFQNTMELYHDQRIWGRNSCVNLDNAVLLLQKMLYSVSEQKPIFYHEKSKSHSKLLPTLEGYDQDNLFSLVLWCQHILIWALYFFPRSGHHIIPISCKASFGFQASLHKNTLMKLATF